MERHNKHLTEYTKFGDVYGLLDKAIESKKKFSVVILKHVLEHVLDPKDLLGRLKALVSENCVLIVVVPNDFSALQLKLLNEKKITPFWINPIEHLSYWARDGLERFVDENGYNVLNYTSDYPVDFDLLVKHTNYNRNKTVGRYSHLKRVRVTNLLCKQSAAECNEYYHSLAKMGMGMLPPYCTCPSVLYAWRWQTLLQCYLVLIEYLQGPPWYVLAIANSPPQDYKPRHARMALGWPAGLPDTIVFA